VTNTVQIAGVGASECDVSNNISLEFTPIGPGGLTSTLYLPIILKNIPSIIATPTPAPTATPTPLAYVSDVKVDPDTNQIFIASPRHDWVYVINGSNDTVARNVPVGHGPTGLTVLDGSAAANNKVFVAHQYGANLWRPGFMAFGVNETAAHNTADTGYAGAAPIKTAANSAHNSRVYVSNYFDKLAVFDGDSGPPEDRLGWVVQKGFQGAYGIDTSSATNRVYLATRDTGELVVFDGHNDRLLQSNYIPTHVKPPQACSLWSVAVNETSGHIFVPCPQLGKVFVLAENQISVLDLEALGVLEERDGYLALVVSPQAAPWIAEISVPGGINIGEEGIAVNTATGRVFITNAQNNTLVILQDGSTPAYVATVAVGTKPQGVDVNPATQKVYVGNTGSNTVSVLNAAPPFSLIKTIPLTP
jgi:YVTN family beta-propeller protein